MQTSEKLPWKESADKNSLPKDEIELAHWLVEQVSWPASHAHVEWKIVPAYKPGKGLGGRPDAKDTLLRFKKFYPDVQVDLIISSQPHAPYQSRLAQNVLGQGSFDIVAPASGKSAKISILFDSLARWIQAEFDHLIGS